MSKDSKTTPLEENLVKNKKIKQERRKQHNQDLIQKMKDGDSLTSFDSMASWFPPRPTIEKDKKLMDQLYKEKSKTPTLQSAKKTDRNENEVDASAAAREEISSKKIAKKDKNSKGAHLREVK